MLELAAPFTAGMPDIVLYSFAADGAYPYSGVIMDSRGNLYGTTSSGGTYGYGDVFELAAPLRAGMGVVVLHEFSGQTDAGYPDGALIMDGSGNLYGTSAGGGAGAGTVFELVNNSGSYTEKILKYFNQDCGGDGSWPRGRLDDGFIGQSLRDDYCGGLQ